MLDESKIDGGDFMQTLAQRMKEEFKEEFVETLGPQIKEEGKEEGKKEAKRDAARQMLKRGFDLDTIIDITGLEKSVIENLMDPVQ